MPVRNFLVIILAAVISLVCYEKASHNHYAATLALAMETIEDNYFEKVDRRELFENAMRGMVLELGDEYSAYISPRDYLQFQQSIQQEFVGIGIWVDGPPRTEQITVISPVFGTPAYEAGMRAGDQILAIDGQSVDGLTLQDAIERIKGPRGSQVLLSVLHEGEEDPVKMKVTRDRIRTRSVRGDTRKEGGLWNYFLKSHPDIGYVRIDTFGEHTVEELRETMEFKDHPIKALIIDLRGNAGGLLTAAVDTCDMFLDSGLIVSTRGRSGRDQESYVAVKGTVVDKNIPVVILIDRFSASASEIVASCMKDRGRAVLVGQRTWGKGTVQNVIPLEGGRSALKLTTASYWRPNGKNIHRGQDAEDEDDWGVRPSEGMDVELDLEKYKEVINNRRQRDVLESDIPTEAESFVDPQLQRAIEVIEKQLGRGEA